MVFGLMALPTEGPTNAFYDSWSNYLHAWPHVTLNVLQTIGQLLMQFVYALGNGVYQAYMNAWKLGSFSEIFTKANGAGSDHTGFNLPTLIPKILIMGMIVFGIVMAVQLLQWTMSSGRKGKEWPKGIVMITLALGLMPMLVGTGLDIAQKVNETVMTTKNNNPMLSMLQNNSVDMKKVALKNFDVKEKDFNKYSPVNANSKDAIVNSPIFSATMDDENVKKALGKSNNDNLHKVFENRRSDDDQKTGPDKLDGGSWVSGDTFKEVYPRVKVNWIGVIISMTFYALAVFFVIIELLLRFYRLAAYSLFMLYYAFRDAQGKRAMQMLSLVEGSIEGAALLPVGVLMFFAFTQFSLSAVAQMGLGWWPYTVLVIAILMAGMKGLMSGFALIDQFTGVPTGQGNAAQTAMAGMMAAKQAGALGKGTAEAAKKAGSYAAAGGAKIKDMVDKAHADSDKMSQRLMDKVNGEGNDSRHEKSQNNSEGATQNNPNQNEIPKDEANNPDTNTNGGKGDKQPSDQKQGKDGQQGFDPDGQMPDGSPDDSTGKDDADDGFVPLGENVPDAPEVPENAGQDAPFGSPIPDNNVENPDEAGDKTSLVPKNDTVNPDGGETSDALEGAQLPTNSVENPDLPVDTDSTSDARVPLPSTDMTAADQASVDGGSQSGQGAEQRNNFDSLIDNMPNQEASDQMSQTTNPETRPHSGTQGTQNTNSNKASHSKQNGGKKAAIDKKTDEPLFKLKNNPFE
ncbi:hypothetical protein JK159_02350 [Weissella minor]|uniref:pLS20_p028 family conjugation system transmembrane protein n=1 Tax=Weissella minor TaxID=1620 RepID=UPI001BAF80EB|nr:hypothetical protein [Weissella minor]MBS0949224.1 hypothetical protein [Weissella minor]